MHNIDQQAKYQRTGKVEIICVLKKGFYELGLDRLVLVLRDHLVWHGA
jgi:hypothetical protein